MFRQNLDRLRRRAVPRTATAPVAELEKTASPVSSQDGDAKDLERKLPINEPATERDAQVTEEAQNGVLAAEAVTMSWSKASLVIVYIT